MDEPTDGLDPNQKHEVRGIIKRMGEKKAIIFSTHILEEVEAVCSRAIIIDRGEIVANGTPEELKVRSRHAGAVQLRLGGVSGAIAKDKLGQLSGADQVTLVSDDATCSEVVVQPKQHDSASLSEQIADLILQENWRVLQFNCREGRLDEVFRDITKPDTIKEGVQAA